MGTAQKDNKTKTPTRNNYIKKSKKKKQKKTGKVTNDKEILTPTLIVQEKNEKSKAFIRIAKRSKSKK